MDAAQRERELLAKEPEDAVWTKRQRGIVEMYEVWLRNEGTVDVLGRREALWIMLLYRIAEVGVRVGERQTWIKEYFDDGDGDDEDGDDREEEEEHDGDDE